MRYTMYTKEDVNTYKRDLLFNEKFHIQILHFSSSSETKNLNYAESVIENFESCTKNLIEFGKEIDIKIEDKFDVSIIDIDEPFRTILEFKFDEFILPIQYTNNSLSLMINCTPKNLLSDFEVENILIGKQLEFFAEKELRNLRQDSLIDFKS